PRYRGPERWRGSPGMTIKWTQYACGKCGQPVYAAGVPPEDGLCMTCRLKRNKNALRVHAPRTKPVKQPHSFIFHDTQPADLHAGVQKLSVVIAEHGFFDELSVRVAACINQQPIGAWVNTRDLVRFMKIEPAQMPLQSAAQFFSHALK